MLLMLRTTVENICVHTYVNEFDRERKRENKTYQSRKRKKQQKKERDLSGHDSFIVKFLDEKRISRSLAEYINSVNRASD